MSETKKIDGTIDAWESGELGRDEKYVKRSAIDEKIVDGSLELQHISIRLQKSLINDFKLIAKVHGLGYQTLMRQILKRFSDSEMKRLLRECILQEDQDRLKKQLDGNATSTNEKLAS